VSEAAAGSGEIAAHLASLAATTVAASEVAGQVDVQVHDQSTVSTDLRTRVRAFTF
jgi:methyl-accepting chemotaxis protein